MPERRGRCRIGCSGWQYDHWKGVFYPGDLPKGKWFSYYAERFEAVEVNNTFYHLPDEGAFAKWRDAAPRGFRYALKYSRYGSHLKHLKDPADHAGVFLARAVGLKSHLGAILVQLPPRWKADPGRLEAFLAAMGGGHRIAVEFRDASWFCREVYEVLGKHGAALCLHDMIEDHPREVTADWLYLRYHGKDYTQPYSPEQLAAMAEEIGGFLEAGRDVFAFFNNDAEGHAARNAAELRERVERGLG